MSHCLMYKKGDSAVVRGVSCDFVRIKYSEVEEYKKKGYVGSLKELTKPKESEEQEFTESDFLSVFKADPERLTKPELVEYGNEEFGLKLNIRMKEKTLIKKISEALEGE